MSDIPDFIPANPNHQVCWATLYSDGDTSVNFAPLLGWVKNHAKGRVEAVIAPMGVFDWHRDTLQVGEMTVTECGEVGVFVLYDTSIGFYLVESKWVTKNKMFQMMGDFAPRKHRLEEKGLTTNEEVKMSLDA